jgi:asparagine synthase (glutamine-hydrolysing)
MRHSLEARAPFLDHELVSYALSLPANLKISGNATKHVLKEAVRPYLPSSIVDRRKQGFRVPLPEWLRTDIADWAKRRLFGSSLINSGLFNMEQISCTWERHQRNIADHANDLWCLLNLAVWYEHWIEGQPVS